jgi:hypothetical protein
MFQLTSSALSMTTNHSSSISSRAPSHRRTPSIADQSFSACLGPGGELLSTGSRSAAAHRSKLARTVSGLSALIQRIGPYRSRWSLTNRSASYVFPTPPSPYMTRACGRLLFLVTRSFSSMPAESSFRAGVARGPREDRRAAAQGGGRRQHAGRTVAVGNALQAASTGGHDIVRWSNDMAAD